MFGLVLTIVAVLELFYNCAAMCSHKARPITEPVPSLPSYVRKGLSTVRVIQILGEESPNNLPPLPVLPWALSLAVANAYRQFRQSRVPTHRSRARIELQKCCDLLEKMRPIWWSAGRMADLGRAALNKASNVPAAAQVYGSGAQRGKQTMADTVIMPITNSLNKNGRTGSSGQQQHLSVQGNGTEQGSNPFIETVVSTPSSLSSNIGVETTMSPDWLNFDAAFENFDAVLGSSGADLSMELLRPFNFEDFGSHDLVG
jgi:hypothetical protein